MPPTTLLRIAALWLACSNAAFAAPPTTAPTAAGLGARIFADPSLSASGAMSCASCHTPSYAHAAPPDTAVVPPGGAEGKTPGFRAAPSLRYLNVGLPFSFDEEGTPSGGF